MQFYYTIGKDKDGNPVISLPQEELDRYIAFRVNSEKQEELPQKEDGYEDRYVSTVVLSKKTGFSAKRIRSFCKGILAPACIRFEENGHLRIHLGQAIKILSQESAEQPTTAQEKTTQNNLKLQRKRRTLDSGRAYRA